MKAWPLRPPGVVAATGFLLLSLLGVAPPARTQSQLPLDAFWVTDGDVHTVTEAAGVVYVGGAFDYLGPLTGSLARLDAATGAADLGFPRVDGQVIALAPDGAGGFYLGGVFTRVGGALRSNLAHVLASGRVSPWNPTASGPVQALAVSGRTVYAGGTFATIGGQPRSNIAALDAAAGAAQPWNPGANGPVFALAPAGALVYAGGSFTNIGGQPRGNIAALDAVTAAATSWNPNANGSVTALAPAGGTVYAGGAFTNIGGQGRNRIAALDAASGAANPWNPNANLNVTDLVVSGSTVYAGGLFTSIGGLARNYIAALDASVDINNARPWNPNPNNAVGALALAGTTVYVGGSFSSIGGQPRSFLAALDATVDTNNATAWNPGANGSVSAIAPAGSQIYVGGQFSSSGGLSRKHIAALDAATGLPLSAWDPGASDVVEALVVSGGRLFAGGFFTNIGGLPRDRIAALDAATGGVIAGWNAGTVDNGVLGLDVSGGRVYAGGNFGIAGGATRLQLAAFAETTGGLVTAWNPSPSSTSFVRTVDVSGSTVYAGGFFNHGGGNHIVALNTSTGAATGWSPNAGNPVLALSASPTVVYAGGDFTSIGGQARNRLAGLDPALPTNNATAWDPNASATVRSILPSGTAVFVGGFFLTIKGQSRKRLAQVDTGVGLPTPWNPDPDGSVFTLALGSGRLFAGGAFTQVGGRARRGLAAFCLASPPAGLNATPGGTNTINLGWTGTGAPSYNVYRSRTAGGPYELLASTSTPSYVDTTAEGGVTYFYVVRAFDQCESDSSLEASAMTTGSCSLAPDFAGAAWAEQATGGTCAVDVGWAPASAPCGGGVIYTVYRGTSASFLPSLANRVATVTSATSYTDGAALSTGTTYYYVVRATSLANGAEDGNLIRHQATPTSCTQGGPDTVQFFTVTAKQTLGVSQNVLEWNYPPGAGSVAVKVYGAAAPSPCPLHPVGVALATVSGTAGQHAVYTDSPLADGVTYCYTLFVDKNLGNFSAGRSNRGRPVDTTCPTCYVKWAFNIGTASLTPPGLGTAALDSLHVVANDSTLYSMRKGAAGGTWPTGWTPLLMSGPSQGRPTTIDLPVMGASRAIFLGSQGGKVHAIDADTGLELWARPLWLAGTMVQAPPSGIFRAFGTAYGIPYDYILVGTRYTLTTGENAFFALNMADGSPVTPNWPFSTAAAGSKIGIITGQATVDYATRRVYFTSLAHGGFPHDKTVWCVKLDDGSLAWAQAYPGITTSPTVRGGHLYVGTSAGDVLALRTSDGVLDWTFPTMTGEPVKGFIMPARPGPELYFSTTSAVLSINDDVGSASENWRRTDISTPSVPVFLIGGSHLYLGSGDGKLYRLNSGNGSTAAAIPLGDPLTPAGVGSPTIDTRQGFAYVGTEAGIVYAVQLPP